MAYLSKPPRTLADRDEELYKYLCRLIDDINARDEQIEDAIKIEEVT